ncbi:hypothetical protein CHS0354_008609 [Potamilus streckersoni]|uniref:Uncharacterized protein n=1 Tax=Potamilus streckersoni TaxID=2493646 RepID=A0AAE0W2B6_9BIVA|nr:hypothetical protein CHS0354_008609 [Potamilus streckersoni]
MCWHIRVSTILANQYFKQSLDFDMSRHCVMVSVVVGHILVLVLHQSICCVTSAMFFPLDCKHDVHSYLDEKLFLVTFLILLKEVLSQL